MSGSVDRTAAAGSAGFRYNANGWLSVGLDLEYNPWFSIDAGRASPGVFNGYGTAIIKHKQIDSWELRTTVNVGTSVMLFDTVGVDKGSVGLYLGASPLGVAVPVGSKARIVIDPVAIAVPAPSVKGFPFYYRQYRATVGVEFSL